MVTNGESQPTKSVPRWIEGAEASSGGMWNATKWLGVGSLGAIAAVILGLDLATDLERAALRYLVWAALALVAGLTLGGLNDVVIKSQRSRGVEIAESESRTRLGKSATTFVLLLQIVALVMLVGSEGLALNKALQGSDEFDGPNELLLQELNEYEGTATELKEVQEVCRQYIEDFRATNAFVSICQVFLEGRSPEPDEVEQMIDRLSQ